MKNKRVYLAGMGIICPLGRGCGKVKAAIQNEKQCLNPLSVFQVSGHDPLPVGEAALPMEPNPFPRTHQLAFTAAEEAIADYSGDLNAVVMGTTTGGMLDTEKYLREDQKTPDLFKYHSVGSIAREMARRYGCKGPAITISTACSSGAVAIKIAMEMLRQGKADAVLAGGADSLCALTYYGFKSLQLIDARGARPFDKDRKGMTVAEGAAVLLLTVHEPRSPIAEFLGAGLSCDAYHPAAPHPRGDGALSSMRAAIEDAGISISDIDYVNLHGTGTIDNDLSEARAVKRLFPGKIPLLSSIKGAMGHSLAASGAIGAIVASMAVSDNMIPANSGCRQVDPDFGIKPVTAAMKAPVSAVLSNSLGFGGNNASLVIGSPKEFALRPHRAGKPLAVQGFSCITGAGRSEKTLETILEGNDCKGALAMEEISRPLPAGKIRRLKRLPRMALALAREAVDNSGIPEKNPCSIFFSTGWGALSETSDFLKRLWDTGEKFPSPIDFIGSVHNSPAGHMAVEFNSTRANITTTGGDYSFEQALLAADLTADDADGGLMVAGCDEAHPELSPLFDRSVAGAERLSDGGGALVLKRSTDESLVKIGLVFYENKENNPCVVESLVAVIGGRESISEKYGVILAGVPRAFHETGEEQKRSFLFASGFKGPVVDYRKFTGEFASASAVGVVAGVKLMENGKIHGKLYKGMDLDLNGKGVLVLNLGDSITAVELVR